MNYHRQVIRMILALVLVIVVISAAAQPEFYEPFFQVGVGQVGVGQVGVGQAGDVDSRMMNSASSNSSESPMVVPDAVRRQSVEFAVTLSAQQQVSAARLLIRFQNGERDDSLIAEMKKIPVSQDGVQIEAMIEALISESEKCVVDGAVWRSGDRNALRLRLLRCSQSPASVTNRSAAVVGVLSLLQQPEAFRGQPVRILGRVARADLVSEGAISGGTTKDDPLPDYWQLWLQPSSGADRPIVALVTSVPDEILHFKEGGSANEAPRVIVQGTFFKRLAYQSSLGADLAPVVVGRLSQRVPPAVASNDERKVDVIGSIAVVVGAIGIGVILAGLVIWRTAASAKRTRRIRRDREVAALKVPTGFNDEHPKHD